MDSAWLSIREDKFFRCLRFYNCICLGSLLKPCRCDVSSQSSEPLKDMHNKQSLKYVFILGHMVLSGAFLDLWVSSLLKDGLARTHLSEQLSEPYQNESAFAWLSILCGPLKWTQPCSEAEMCWAKSLPWTACGRITRQCPSLSLKSRRARLVHAARTGSLGEACPPGLELGAREIWKLSQ